LVACIISIRTYDEVTVPTSIKLFARARTPAAIAQLSSEAINKLIIDSTYHQGKSHQIKAIAEQIENEFHGNLPANFETLTSFKGFAPSAPI